MAGPFRRGLAMLLAIVAPIAGWALEINTASQAELEALKGIGTALSERILAERSNRAFTDWPDAMARVRGLGPAVAMRLSEDGLRVDGMAFRRTPPASGSTTSRAASAIAGAASRAPDTGPPSPHARP